MSSEEYREKLREMFEPCLARPDLKGQIEIVSLEWLMEMANPSPSETTPLGDDKPGVVVGMAELARDLKKRKLQEPLVVAVGMGTGRARLEGGNHRVGLLLEMGFLHAPAVCWVGASHVGLEGNGSHEGRPVKFWPGAKPLVAMGPFDERYFEKPSAILPSAPVWSLDEASRSARSKAPAAVAAAKPPERKPRAARAPKDESAEGAVSQEAGSPSSPAPLEEPAFPFDEMGEGSSS